MSSVSLSSMVPASQTGMEWAGPRSLTRTGTTWDCWEHVNYPSFIYHAQSTDLFNWSPDDNYTLSPFNAPQNGWLPRVDQVADASLAGENGNI